MTASSRSARTFAGPRQLAAALIATLALALVLVVGVSTLVMTNRAAPNTAHPVVTIQSSGSAGRFER